MGRKYRIKAFSQISGVSVYNLRFYDAIGLPSGKRNEKGYREYGLNDAYMVNTFNMLLAEGFSLKEAVARLKPVSAAEYADELEQNAREMQQQIQRLETRRDWNRKMAYVYRNLAREQETVRLLDVPEQWFITGVEGEDLAPSLPNGAVIENWRQHLPVCMYSGLSLPDKDLLGLCVPAEYARSHGLLYTPAVLTLPARTCLCLLDEGKLPPAQALQNSPLARQQLRRMGRRAGWPLLAQYLMVNETTYQTDLNYLLVPLQKDA